MNAEEVELLQLALLANTREEIESARAKVDAWRKKNGISKPVVN